MAKVHIESVPELIKKAGEIRKQLALGTRRIGNVHIGGPMSATDAAVAIYYKYMDFDPDEPTLRAFIKNRCDLKQEACRQSYKNNIGAVRY